MKGKRGSFQEGTRTTRLAVFLALLWVCVQVIGKSGRLDDPERLSSKNSWDDALSSLPLPTAAFPSSKTEIKQCPWHTLKR